MPQPAPPSLLTSTDPPLLWDDISLKLTYTLSGKSHITPGGSVLHPPPPHHHHHLCCIKSTGLTRGKRVWASGLLFHSPQQERFGHRRLPADVCHACRTAGSAKKLYSEQGDGLQRVQTVPVRPGARWVTAHVHWSAFLKDVLKTLVTRWW